MKWLESLNSTYKNFALFVFNLLIFFILANFLLAGVYFVKDTIRRSPRTYKVENLFTKDGNPVQNGQRDSLEIEWFDFNACKEIGEEYASEVLNEFYQLIDVRSLVSHPWPQFSPLVFNGKLVNIDTGERGFPRRRTLNPPMENNKQTIRILALGNSTTSGVFVSDEHTWPSFLSQILNERAKKEDKSFNIEVINFGRSGYYLSQEVILLFDLLRNGYRPSLVIFLDGYNLGDFDDDVPRLSTILTNDFLSCYYYNHFAPKCIFLPIKFLPVYRFIHSIKIKLSSFVNRFQQTNETANNNPRNLTAEANHVADRFEQNRKSAKALCSSYGANALFILQPHPLYKYKTSLFRSDLEEKIVNGNDTPLIQTAYEIMRTNKGVVDFSNIYKEWGENKKAYVDDYHYSPAFNKFLAVKIASLINLNELSVIPQIINDSKKMTPINLQTIETAF